MCPYLLERFGVYTYQRYVCLRMWHARTARQNQRFFSFFFLLCMLIPPIAEIFLRSLLCTKHLYVLLIITPAVSIIGFWYLFESAAYLSPRPSPSLCSDEKKDTTNTVLLSSRLREILSALERSDGLYPCPYPPREQPPLNFYGCSGLAVLRVGGWGAPCRREGRGSRREDGRTVLCLPSWAGCCWATPRGS